MHPIITVIAAPDARQQAICKYHQFFEGTMHGVAYCQVVLDEQQNPVDYVYLEVMPGIREQQFDVIADRCRVALTGQESTSDQYLKHGRRTAGWRTGCLRGCVPGD